MEFCEDCQCEMITCTHLERSAHLKECRDRAWDRTVGTKAGSGSNWCETHDRRLTDCRCFRRPPTKFHDRTKCDACGKRFTTYMVNDALWERAGLDGDNNVCLYCLGKLAGRALGRDDFRQYRNFPVNDGIDELFPRSGTLKEFLGEPYEWSEEVEGLDY